MPRRKDTPPGPTDDATQLSEGPQKFSYSAPLGKKALLVVMSHEGFGKSLVLDRQNVVLGRQKDCEFVIDDPLLSRRHCLITCDAQGDFFLEDLNSTNATLLNSRKVVDKMRLRYGDRIVLGDTVVRFFLEEELGKK